MCRGTTDSLSKTNQEASKDSKLKKYKVNFPDIHAWSPLLFGVN